MSSRLGAPKPIRPAGQDVDMAEPEAVANDAMHLDGSGDALGAADAGPSSPSRPSSAAADADAPPQQPEYSDPNLLASYPIYLSTSLPPSSSLQLFQYPTYPRRQPLPVPSNSLSRGMTQAIRWRPKAGWVQVELPLDLRAAVYHEEKGAEMGAGVRQLGGEIGQGRGAGVAKREDSDEEDVGGRRKSRKGKGKGKSQDAALNGVNGEGLPSQKLRKIRLESDVMPHMTKYCVGVMRDQALHLTHLDRVVQLRPSLHHLDGMDALEAESTRNAAKALSGEGDESDAGGGGGAGADEKKPAAAYNVSVKVAGAGPGGPGMGGGAGDGRDQLMASKRRAEGEEWVELQWRDMHGVHKSTVQSTLSSQLFAGSKTPLRCKTKPRDYLP